MDSKQWNKSVAKQKTEKLMDKYIEAYRLKYSEGMTYDDIAESIGYKDRSGAYNAVKAAIKFYNTQRADKVEDARAVSLADLYQYKTDLEAKLGKGFNSITSVEYESGKGNKKIQTYDEAAELKVYNTILKVQQQIDRLLGTYQDHTEVNVTGEIKHTQVQDLRDELLQGLTKDVIDVEATEIENGADGTPADRTDTTDTTTSGESNVVEGTETETDSETT